VLAQPTRARLFAHLAALARPAGTDELAAEFGLHPSGVRVHLQQMHSAGLLARERVSQRLGRPRDCWSIAPDALPAGEPPGAYRQLACWLARSIAPRAGRLREIERAGREVGRALSPGASPAAAEESLGRTLTALGFAPQREPRARDRTLFRLGNCPYREAVHENQPVVCTLHRGLTLGLLDALAPKARLVDFVPKDPDRAGCLVEVAGFDHK
jgi:predicted ArsR family transcriptional regulator